MNQIAEFRTQVATRGRQLKFTPERIQQIKNLVERGKCRGEIAELVGEHAYGFLYRAGSLIKVNL